MIFEVVKIKPTSITGEGGDSVGSFSLDGTIEGEHIKFTKQYHGAHSVLYEGTIDKHHEKISGTWRIGGHNTGNFEIKMLNEPDKIMGKFKLASDGKISQFKKEQWREIGEQASQLAIHKKHVFCIKKDDNSIWRWNHNEPNSWVHIGDRCAKLIVTGKKHVVCLNNEDGSYWHWNG